MSTCAKQRKKEDRARLRDKEYWARYPEEDRQ
jgi:hypothetical protein